MVLSTHKSPKIKVGYMPSSSQWTTLCLCSPCSVQCWLIYIINTQRAVMNMPSLTQAPNRNSSNTLAALSGWKYYFQKWSGRIAMLSNHNPHYTCKRFHHQHSLPNEKRGKTILIFFSLPSRHSHFPTQLKQHFCGQIPHLCSFLEAINCPE